MKSDAYLRHAFGLAEEAVSHLGEEEQAHFSASPIRLPMLLHVDRRAWDPEGIPDLHVFSRMDNIISCIGSLSSLSALERDPAVFSIQASRRGSGADVIQSIPLTRADSVLNPPLSERGDGAIVAIVDYGIDVLHEAFLDSAGNTRIFAIWDQSDSSGQNPAVWSNSKELAGLNYGTVHDEAVINNYISAGSIPVTLSRDNSAPTASERGHGTHVASIAAGRGAGKFSGGVAPDAKMIVVISSMNVSKDDPISIGYSTAHVDALSFIDYIANDKKMPVVVNLSQGMHAGAHDGSSPLELAFDAFVRGGRKAGRIVVKSAGNERGKDGHAKLKMASSMREILPWKSTQHSRADHIEIWFDAVDDLSFTVRNPNGDVSRSVNRKQQFDSDYFPSGNKWRMEFTRFHVDNGSGQLLISHKYT